MLIKGIEVLYEDIIQSVIAAIYLRSSVNLEEYDESHNGYTILQQPMLCFITILYTFILTI